jgi:hypothetical protein
VNEAAWRTKLAGASVTVVAGERDGFVTPAARATVLERLQSYHGTAREILFPGEHVLDPPILRTLLQELPTHVR